MTIIANEKARKGFTGVPSRTRTCD